MDLKPSAPDSREREELQLQRGICRNDWIRKNPRLFSSKGQRNTRRNVNFDSGNTSFPLWVIVLILILESSSVLYVSTFSMCGIGEIYHALIYFGRGGAYRR